MSLHIGSSNISDIYVGNSKISDIYVGNDLVYTSNKGPDLTVPLYFEANDPTEACTVKFEVVQTLTGTWNPTAVGSSYFPSVPSPNWAYSYDRNTWTSYTLGTDISLGGTNPARVYFKTLTEYTNTPPWRMTYTTTDKVALNYNTCLRAAISGSVKAQGNVMSLISLGFANRTDAPDYCFEALFADCTSLTKAPVLPATTLAPSCYTYMFNGCTSLTNAPALPATTLAPSCYTYMFNGCTSLTNAPALPATTLADFCYGSMFNGCTSLTSAPALPATTLTNFCYSSMFSGSIRANSTASAPCVYPYRIPESGTGTGGDTSLSSMFTNIGGTETFTPTINTSFYISVPVMD